MNSNSKQKHPWVTAERHTVMWLFSFSHWIVHTNRTKVGGGHRFHPTSFIITFVNWLYILFNVIVASKDIIQSEIYKGRFHSERPFNGKMKVKILYECWKFNTNHSPLFNKNNCIQSIYFPHAIHTNQHLYDSLDIVLYTRDSV